MIVFLYDKTGTDNNLPRQGILEKLLTAKNLHCCLLEEDVTTVTDTIKSENWLRLEVNSANALVLAHSAELGLPSIKTAIKNAAESGATVVRYSGGEIDEKEEIIGKGSFLNLQWDTILELISRLPNSFEFSDFRAAVESIRKRHLLNGLAILSWCISFPSEQDSVVKSQMKWKTGRDKWLKVFSECSRDDLVIACGGSAGKSLPNDMSEATKLIDWLLPLQNGEFKTPAEPDFAQVLRQIKQKFGIYL